jgi:hypothetical protein
VQFAATLFGVSPQKQRFANQLASCRFATGSCNSANPLFKQLRFTAKGCYSLFYELGDERARDF